MSGNERNVATPRPFDIVTLAASLGGVRAYAEVLSQLPADFPVPVVLTQHRRNGGPDSLCYLLDRGCPLPVRAATDGDLLSPGTVYVGPAGRQVRIDPDRRLAVTVEEEDAAPGRPGDALFASAAEQYGRRALGVILTGRLDDGAAGARALKAAGGRVLVQDPSDAEASGMPAAALATGCLDWVLPLELLTPALTALTMAPGAASLLKVTPPPWAALSAGPSGGRTSFAAAAG